MIIISPKDEVRLHGSYKMTLSPQLKFDENGHYLEEESTGRITLYDLNHALKMLWGDILPIGEAHSALEKFKAGGIYAIFT